MNTAALAIGYIWLGLVAAALGLAFGCVAFDALWRYLERRA